MFGASKTNSASTNTGKYSVYFNGGNANQLTFPSSDSSFAFGTGAFTVEFWYYTTQGPAQWEQLFGTNGNNGIFFNCRSGYLDWTNNQDQAALIRSNWPAQNQWNHIALTQNSSGNHSVFINGSRTGNTSSTWAWGQAGGNIGGAQGYISNLRIVKGSAVYNPTSTTITVPTSPLTAISGTQLLTCQNNTLKDNSVNNYTIGYTGTQPTISVMSPF